MDMGQLRRSFIIVWETIPELNLEMCPILMSIFSHRHFWSVKRNIHQSLMWSCWFHHFCTDVLELLFLRIILLKSLAILTPLTCTSSKIILESPKVFLQPQQRKSGCPWQRAIWLPWSERLCLSPSSRREILAFKVMVLSSGDLRGDFVSV